VAVRETRHHEQAHNTFSTPFLAARQNKTAVEHDRFRWPVLVMVALKPHNICCSRTWSSNQPGGEVILASSTFFNQLPQQKKSEISVGIFSPT
jgi:hypothetical protein